jgi:membrane fusion protein, multidrug efflux system
VKVRAQFDNAEKYAVPNQFINAQLLVKTLHNVVTVPTAAIQRGHREVTSTSSTPTTGCRSDLSISARPMSPMAAVNSVGERVVVDGTDRSRDGARVIMPAAPSQAPAADPPSNAQDRQPQNPTPNAQPQSPCRSQHQHK